jgi:U4/U6.U5 tri-snRNP-associated protein 3
VESDSDDERPAAGAAGGAGAAPAPPKPLVEPGATLVLPRALEGASDEAVLSALFGFSEFGSTKGVAVRDNVEGAGRGGVAQSQHQRFRQYMNRRGGFNRPLDAMK